MTKNNDKNVKFFINNAYNIFFESEKIGFLIFDTFFELFEISFWYNFETLFGHFWPPYFGTFLRPPDPPRWGPFLVTFWTLLITPFFWMKIDPFWNFIDDIFLIKKPKFFDNFEKIYIKIKIIFFSNFVKICFLLKNFYVKNNFFIDKFMKLFYEK